jgi:tetratricopeptide (TPR) repeat protein
VADGAVRSLDEAWACFLTGDVDACVEALASHLAALKATLGTAAARVDAHWGNEVAGGVDEAYHAGLLLRRCGALDAAAAAQRAVLATTWPLAGTSTTARRYQASATSELALVEAHRNRASDGLRRVRELRQELLDAELRDLLAGEDDLGEPSLDLLEGQMEYLEHALGLNEEERLRPRYLDDEEPVVDLLPPPSTAPQDPLREPDRARWPDPLEGVLEVPTDLRGGLERFSELTGATWQHLYAGRQAAATERHDEALEAFNRAIQSAEAVHAAFRGSWEARRTIALAVAGRSTALEQLELSDRAVEDAALAAGIFADAAAAFPQVIELLTSWSWAAGAEGWRRCRAGRPHDEVISCCELAMGLIDRARTTRRREPDDVLAILWLRGHAARHLWRARRYPDLLRNMAAGARFTWEVVPLVGENPKLRRAQLEMAASTPGPFGAFLRRSVGWMYRDASPAGVEGRPWWKRRSHRGRKPGGAQPE